MTQNQKQNLGITESYAMTSANSVNSQIEAFEADFTSRLCETRDDFKKILLKSFSKSQQDRIFASANKHQEQSKVAGRGYQEHDNGYRSMTMEFLRWKDGDPTGWISIAENFFRF